MNYYLYKLDFTTPVHFGTSESALSLYDSNEFFLADTLFSALCHQSNLLYGEDGINKLLDFAKNGKLILSDGMIWKDDDFYLPKPYFSGQKNSLEVGTKIKKKIKKLHWIPITKYNDLLSSIRGEKQIDLTGFDNEFGTKSEKTQVEIKIDESMPYQVAQFKFFKNCGLYFVVATEKDFPIDFFNTLLEALSYSGIGGKISSGLGKFIVDDIIFLNEPFDSQTEWLYDSLSNESANSSLLLTSSIPNDEEMEKALKNASYQIVRRSGFVFSERYSDSYQKKKTEFFLSSGSIIKNRYLGSLRIVAKNENHSVYRYSRPLFMGVEL